MFEPIPLPYAFYALEPYYSEDTLRVHYETLYKGYINNLNRTQSALELARSNNNYENIKCLEKNLSFFGSGTILHKLFFENMTSNSTTPKSELIDRITKDFGSFKNFKEQFIEASKSVEASGWCILAWVPELNKLEILQCEKHQNLTLWGCKPLLVLDMWEHSYFLQYKANRNDYVDAFWNIINWDIINERFL